MTTNKSYKFVHEDKVGNKYYPHTMADIVHVDENTTIGDWVTGKDAELSTAINNATTQANYAKTQGDYAKTQGDSVNGRVTALETNKVDKTVYTTEQATQDKRIKTIEDAIKNGDIGSGGSGGSTCTGSNVTLGGESQSNFNFIADKVVQDGLVSSGSIGNNLNTNSLTSTFILNLTNQITHTFPISKITYGDSKKGFEIQIKNDGFTRIHYFDSKGIQKYVDYTINIKNVKNIVIVEHSFLYILFDNKTIRIDDYCVADTTPITFREVVGDYCYYNKHLSPQEINHNFNVLNNSPSISALEVTNEDNQTSTLSFATDSEHVKMATGRTLEEEYMGVLRTMGKEYVSTTGEDITVENGIEARLIGAEIQGNTLKNLVGDSRGLNSPKSYIIKNVGLTIADGFASMSESNGSWFRLGIMTQQLKPNTTYTAMIYIKKYLNTTMSTTKDMDFFIAKDSSTTIFKGTTCKYGHSGIVKFTFTTDSTLNWNIALYGYTEDFEAKDIIIVESAFLDGYFEGLSSTVATITNNGIKHTFYASEEDKANQKPICLPFAEDKLSLNEDGSATWVDASKEVILNGSETFNYLGNLGNKYHFNIQVGQKPNSIPISSDLKVVTGNDNSTDGALSIFIGNSLNLYVPNDLVPNGDIFKLKEYLNKNPKRLIVLLATPTTTHIPKQLCPIIPTNKSNIFSVGGAVKASRFTANIPIDKFADMQMRLALMENVLNTKSNLDIFANYVTDEYNSSINTIQEVMK